MDKDTLILTKIVKYSNETNETISYFDLDFNKLKSDHIAKNAIAMCVLQIGELVTKMTTEFKQKYTGMPWKDIIGMRTIVAHTYGSIDMDILWKIATINIPDLKRYCENILNEKDNG